jgi:hypothetical protein
MKHTDPIQSGPNVVHVDGDALSIDEVDFLIGRLDMAKKLARMDARHAAEMLAHDSLRDQRTEE